MNNTLPLQELFNNRIFQVPEYQRGYAWENQQVEEFLDDLDLLISTRNHYTGTIVLYQPSDATHKKDEEGTSYVETDVVDGQQRLTTIVLLLNEISRALHAYEGSSALAQGIRKNYVECRSSDGQPLYKLSLNKDTNEFFKSSVLSETPGAAGPPITAAQRLLDAKEQIASYLHKTDGEAVDSGQWLKDLHSKITTQLHFNLYEVDHTAEVGVIFEVMNDRGKQLTNLEKVKNYLLYTASTLDVETHTRDELTESVNDAWADMLKRLMAAGLSSPSDEDQLLRAHWLMQYDPQSRNWDGSKSIKKRFDLRRYTGQPSQIVNDLYQYIKGLSDACVYYCDARGPARDGAFGSFSFDSKSEVKLWSSKLVRIDVMATFLPLLMAVRVRWPSEPQKYLQVVQLCELFAFRFYQVARYYSHFRQSQMFHLAYDMRKEMEFDTVIRKIKQIYSHGDERNQFKEFTDAGTPRNWYGRKGLKYFLYEYEQHRASAIGASPRVTWEDISRPDLKDTIEHVLPQSIEDKLCWQECFNKDAHEEYVHDIGNLTLTRHNPFYSNKCFPDKKGTIDVNGPCYAKSPLFQEQELARHDDWTAEIIDERRAQLLKWAKERWHVDFRDTGTEEVETDDEDDRAGEE